VPSALSRQLESFISARIDSSKAESMAALVFGPPGYGKSHDIAAACSRGGCMLARAMHPSELYSAYEAKCTDLETASQAAGVKELSGSRVTELFSLPAAGFVARLLQQCCQRVDSWATDQVTRACCLSTLGGPSYSYLPVWASSLIPSPTWAGSRRMV
jgi:hypothetical protein